MTRRAGARWRMGRQLRLPFDAAPGLASPRRQTHRADGASTSAVEVRRTRLMVAGVLFALSFVGLGVRLVDLMVLRGGGGEPSLARSAGARPVTAQRAPIVDRNGVLLAANLGTASLYATPRRVLDPREAAEKLVQVLPELDYEAVLAKLSSKRRFVWLKRKLTPRQYYAVNRLGLPGLAFREDESRVYPQGALLAHVLGYTDVDNRGISGLEKRFDRTLRDPARGGTPLQLSIDVRVQHVVRRQLMRAVARFRAAAGAGLVLDVGTGEVLALVSLPDFDPNRARGASSDSLFNRATLAVYEMGSTFKVFTLAMALEAGTAGPDRRYDTTRPIRVSRFVIRDSYPKARPLSVPEIFVYSSNIGAAKMALEVGGVRQRAFLEKLGLLRRARIELPEVGLPLAPERWREVNTMTVAFGHGIAVSPVNMAAAVAATVNGGVLIPTTLLKRPDGASVEGRRVVSARTSRIVRRLMRLVVEQGTGRRAAAPGYLIGGKTGTAEKPQRGRYQRKALVSSFVGAFPIDAPRYLVLVLLDEPKGTPATRGYAGGGWTAAPVVGRIVSRIAPILGVRPVDETETEVRKAMFVDWRERGRDGAAF